MARHTTFRFCLDPTVEQSVALARHVGAARFAYNQCLRLHLDTRERHRALDRRGAGTSEIDRARDAVPCSRFGLINAFGRWKRCEAAGRGTQDQDDAKGWVGVDRGLHALVVAGARDGTETLRIQAPKVLAAGLRQQRRLAHAVSRKKRGSANRRKAGNRLARHHVQVRDTQQHFLHQVSNACRRDSTGPHHRVSETSPDDAGTIVQTAPAA